MTTTTSDAAAADRALKGRHRAMWALGDYPAVAREVVAGVGPALVEACHVRRGDRVLDVAAGTGSAAIPAALAGADVVASDLTPELFDDGRARAAAAGVDLEWREADAEALPFEDASFDVVLSAIGVMFAPHHAVAAGELVRVCRPGGTIGVLSWTPSGFIGQLFATMKPYVAPPPPGVQPAPLWGDEAHVRELFGDAVTGLEARRGDLPVDRFATGEDFRDFFKTNYGPTVVAYRGLADDPDRTAALDADLAELGRRALRTGPDGSPVMDWEYLVVTARRAG
jgi:SAM-dependent methyltransferase